MPKISPQVAGQQYNTTLWKDQLKSSWNIFAKHVKNLSQPTLKSKSNKAALDNTKQIFSNYFATQIKAMTDGMSKSHVDETNDAAQKALDAIMKRTFGKLEAHLKERGSIFFMRRSTMKEANKLAQDYFARLKPLAQKAKTHDLRAEVEAARDRPDPKPQILKKPGGGFQLIRRAPKIETLVLQGGGAKGIGNPPALVELERAGALSNLKDVVGSSAGALTAVALSVGMNGHEIEDVIKGDTKALVKTDERLRKVYPELKFRATAWATANFLSLFSSAGHGEANRMISLLDKMQGNAVKEHLDAEVRFNPNALFQLAGRYAKKTGGDPAKIEARMRELMSPDYSKDRTGKMVTFGDMEMMHFIAPQKFKNIQLTGYDMTNQKGVLFNAKNDPDMPIAYAARVSMSHPFVAKGVELPEKYGLEDNKLADGGIASNAPLEAAFGGDRKVAAGDVDPVDKELQEKRAKTGLLVFEGGGSAYKVLHGDDKARIRKTGLSDRIYASNPNAGADATLDKKKIHATGPNAVVVHHGDIGTLDVNASEERKKQAALDSTEKTLEHLGHRVDQAWAVEFDSVEDALHQLSDHEKQQIIDDGPPEKPDPKDYGSDQSFKHAVASYAAERELYDLVAEDADKVNDDVFQSRPLTDLSKLV